MRLLALLDIPPSDGYVATLASSGMVVYPAGRREILQTINEAQEQRVSDLILFDICKSVMVLQKVSAADLLSVFDDARKQGYPLTFCYLKWMVDEEVEIVGLLESIGTSRTGEDRLAWLGLRLLILLPLCADEGEAQRMFDEWLNTNLAEFTTLEIGDDMEKLALIGLLTQCLMMTRHLGLDRVAEIEKLAQALTVSVEINEITKGGMKMMERELASLKAAAERS